MWKEQHFDIKGDDIIASELICGMILYECLQLSMRMLDSNNEANFDFCNGVNTCIVVGYGGLL